MEKSEAPCSADEKAKQCNHYEKQSVSSSKVDICHVNGNSTPRYVPKRIDTYVHTKTLLLIAIKYKQLKYLLADE